MKLYEKAMVVFMAVLSPMIALATDFTITPPTFDYAQLGTYAGTILTALAAIWLIRKFIKMTNRS
jgi:hypothetical protein